MGATPCGEPMIAKPSCSAGPDLVGQGPASGDDHDGTRRRYNRIEPTGSSAERSYAAAKLDDDGPRLGSKRGELA